MASHPPPPSSNNPQLRVVFMGTPALAARVLERLLSAHSAAFAIVGVVTRPDKPRGRGMKLEPSEVGAVAARHALPILKPSKIRTPEFLGQLTAFASDVLVVVAYGRILPNPVLDAPRLMPINLHASLLPRYRGAAPVEGAILGGEHESGVTIIRITEEMDAGPILLQRAILLAPGETQGSLKAKLAELGADTLLDALVLLARAELHDTPQDESRATYTSLIKKADALIDWTIDAAAIERTVRAFDPWPVARTRFANDELMLWKTALVRDDIAAGSPGEILRLEPTPLVGCGRGRLELLEVQAQGRRRMNAVDFFRGKRAIPGMRLG